MNFEYGDSCSSDKLLKDRLSMYGIEDAWSLVQRGIDMGWIKDRPRTHELVRELNRRKDNIYDQKSAPGDKPQ